MTGFIIRTENSSFATEAELPDVSRLEEAHARGIRGALMIAADEIYAGRNAATVELIISNTDDQVVKRSAVTITVAPLISPSHKSLK